MSRKRYVDDNFWVDNWVSDLDFQEKSFFLYLLTNSHTNIAGIYEVPIKTIAFDTELSRQDVENLFQKMQAKVRYVNGWVILRNGIKHQNYKNSKIKTGIEKILLGVPDDLFEFLNVPSDFSETRIMTSSQATLFDDSTMTQDDSYMTPEEYKLNIIKLNKIKSNEMQAKPAGSSKELSEKQKKRQYALAMEREREQEDRAEQARHRTGGAAERLQVKIKGIQRGNA